MVTLPLAWWLLAGVMAKRGAEAWILNPESRSSCRVRPRLAPSWPSIAGPCIMRQPLGKRGMPLLGRSKKSITGEDSFVDTMNEKTAQEIRDEALDRFRENDLGGLRRIITALQATTKAKHRAKHEAHFFVEFLIQRVKWERAEMKERATNRVATFTVGLKARLKHNIDFMAFEKRVLSLFWWRGGTASIFLAPYFTMLQSSGTGKTRLLMALRQHSRTNRTGEVDYDCKTILCADIAVTEFENRDVYFDETISFFPRKDMTSDRTNDQWYQIVYKLATLVHRSPMDKVVLLFDEAQYFLNDDGYSFRRLQWWLREKRAKQVVAVFASTSLKLAIMNSHRDYPPFGTSRDPKPHYVNWSEENRGPTKLYDPFFRIYTTGCYNKNCPPDNKATSMSDFERAAYFGRPKFAYLQTRNQLVASNDATVTEGGAAVIANTNLHAILKRMLLSQTNWRSNKTSLCSILGSRIHMGTPTSFEDASKLVSEAYAHLVHFRPAHDNNNDETAVARIAFMPDPVCAALAMGLMQETWTVTGTKGDEPLIG